MIMKKLIAISILLISQTVFAHWEAKELTRDEPVEGTKHLTLTISSIQFKSKTAKTVVFNPSAPPYSLVEIKKYTFDDKDYFLTSWVSGASSMVLRVFRPDISNLPICQETTDAEETELRKNKDVVELSVTKVSDHKSKDFWSQCHKLGQDRKINSISKANKKPLKPRQK